MKRRDFIKSVAIGVGALSVPVVVAATEPYSSFESVEINTISGFKPFWEAPNGETITSMMEYNGVIYAETAGGIYAINGQGRTIHQYPASYMDSPETLLNAL